MKQQNLRDILTSNEPNKVIGTLFLLIFIAFCMFVASKVIESKLESTSTQTEAEWKY